MTEFREGDRVRYVGPPDPYIADGELGWLLNIEEELMENIVEWDGYGTVVMGNLTHLEKVGDRNEPDPHKRIARDPHGS